MNRAEFKRQVLSLFSESVDGLSLEEKVNYIENLLIEYQKMNEDERIRAIKENPGQMKN